MMAKISNSFRFVVVMATSAAAMVKVTHKALDGPDVQETDKGRFDFIKTVILACFADAAEQKSAQADRPDHDQSPEQDRPRIHTRAQETRQC